MIIKVNFLTKEYGGNILIGKAVKLGGMAIAGLLVVELIAMYFIGNMITQKENEIVKVKQDIATTQAAVQAVIAESKTVPDLSTKINIMNDLFAQSNLRFSEILYNLAKDTPGRIWYTSFTYIDNKILLKGVGMEELSIYALEKKMRESGFYTDVRPDYIRDIEVVKTIVKEFQYQLTAKIDTPPPTVATGAAISTPAAVNK